MSRFVLVCQSFENARKDAEPFIPDSMVIEGLYGIEVFGLYDTIDDASEALRKFPSDGGWNLSIKPLRSLPEQLENPYASMWHGDSP